jgi:hypothetical protein
VLLARHYIRKGEKVEKKIDGFAATNAEIKNANRELRILNVLPAWSLFYLQLGRFKVAGQPSAPS